MRRPPAPRSTKLDTHFEKSAKDLRTVAGDAPSKGGGGGGGGDESGGGSPLAGRQGGGTHVVSGVPAVAVAARTATPAW